MSVASLPHGVLACQLLVNLVDGVIEPDSRAASRFG